MFSWIRPFRLVVMGIFGLLAVVPSSCSEAGADTPPLVEQGWFEPVTARADGIEFSRFRGQYQRIGDWVYVHLDMEFTNTNAENEVTGIRVVPPFEPAPEPFTFSGHLSAVASSYAGDECGGSPELLLQAQAGADIVVRCDPSGSGGGTTLLYGLNIPRGIVGTIAYRTTGQYLY